MLPPGDAVWVGGSVVLNYGMLTAPLLASVTVPNVASLNGATLGWQGVTFDTGGAFGVTNPAWFVVH